MSYSPLFKDIRKKMPKVKYHPDFCEKTVDLMAKGYYKTRLAAYFKVTERTIHNWMKEHEDFKEAYEIGYPLCFDWWMTEGKKKYMDAGNDKGFKYWHCIVRNVFGFDVQESKTGTTNNISISNMNVLNSKSESELLEIFQQKSLQIQNLSQQVPVQIEHQDDRQSETD